MCVGVQGLRGKGGGGRLGRDVLEVLCQLKRKAPLCPGTKAKSGGEGRDALSQQ